MNDFRTVCKCSSFYAKFHVGKKIDPEFRDFSKIHFSAPTTNKNRLNFYGEVSIFVTVFQIALN